MAYVNVKIRMDSATKKAFAAFCDDVGLTMTDAFTPFVKKTLSENHIPFEISRPVPNAETLEALAETERMVRDRSYGKAYSSGKELLQEILAEDDSDA